jgi:hypothetical protein
MDIRGFGVIFAALLASGGGIALSQADETRSPRTKPDIVERPAPGPLPPYSPPVRDGAMTNLYWGDTHLHTNISADAYMMGNQSLTPDDAFRFARGEEVTALNGMKARLRLPLDFLVVSDHSEFLGVFAQLRANNPDLDKWETGKRWGDWLRAGDWRKVATEFGNSLDRFDERFRVPEKVQKSIWSEVGRTADRFNNPGRFTAFIGYEWSSTPAGDNLHRIVIYRDGGDTTSKILPFSALDSTDPEALWKALERYEAATGGEVLSIPHNSNLSNGLMFAPTRFDGSMFTRDYAQARARWEPVAEITQTKGTSETHPTLSPTDEFAGFEIWDKGNIMMSRPKQPQMLRTEYIRAALRDGLKHEAKLGANPFKFGLIGSTDSHNALSTHAEDNFFGKLPGTEPGPARGQGHFGGLPQMPMNWQIGASGLAAVWSTGNSRAALFDAMKRREVYATTGSRIQVRFFGGWNFGAGDVERPDYVRVGYAKGVPMGGELMRDPRKRAPVFMIAASKDPDEANLDRVQVVKGWLDAKGETHEKIFDVALSDGRKPDPKTGKVKPVGSTVNRADASYRNSIGDPELTAVWRDPSFDPNLRAFYYVRVLEIPKPRWTAYDARYFKTLPAKGAAMTVQDRAYTSPIWYNP